MKLLEDDWAGCERSWSISEWVESLEEWLMHGSGMFRGYAALEAGDQRVFENLINAGKNISAQIKQLKTQF